MTCVEYSLYCVSLWATHTYVLSDVVYIHETSLKILKEYLEAVNRTRTDMSMAERKRTNTDPRNTTQETRD